MAYCTMNATREGASQWTQEQNQLFEDAIAKYYRDTPDKWNNIARAVGGGKTVHDVRQYYELLLSDINRIHSGQVPLPVYKSSGGRSNGSMAFEEHRFKHLKL